MKKDNDPEKHVMKGQTEVKHTILEKYLQPWLYKTVWRDGEVHYVDGFAGWGRYEDGSPGSPLISLEVANRSLGEDVGNLDSKLDEFRCTFVEKDSKNFVDLEDAIAEDELTRSPKLNVETKNCEFAEFAEEYLSNIGPRVPPTFIFIDPFGFSGVPFDVVKRLINVQQRGMELFINFMSGKMARFQTSNNHGVAIDDILGTDRWRTEIGDDLSRDERAEEFTRLYEEQLRDVAGVEYVWPFEMKKEATAQTNYYLVHATNHFDGFKIMKDIMFNAGAEEQFAYLGPEHYKYHENQTKLFTDERDESDRRIKKLADFLHERFDGKRLRFDEVMKQTYLETTLIETHYRQACKKLVSQNRATIHNFDDERPDGTGTGLGKGDEVEFYSPTGLSDFV